MLPTTERNPIRVWHVALALAVLLGAIIIGIILRNHSAPAPPLLGANSGVTAMPVTPVATALKSSEPKGGAPTWEDLTPTQRQALEPLAADWHKLGPVRKKKWLVLVDKFPSLSADGRRRVHARMTEWTKLTPQQRRLARDSYSRAKKLDSEQKSARWEQYQQLPEEQKEKLANSVTPKRIATLPPAESKSKNKNIPQIKSVSRPALEKSLTPQPNSHTEAATIHMPPESIPAPPLSSATATLAASAPTQTPASEATAQPSTPSASPVGTTITEPTR